MRGLSIDLHGVSGAPPMSVTDYGSNALNYQLTPFEGGRARIVGFADFNSLPPEPAELSEHETMLLDHTRRVLPGMSWSGRRPTYPCWRPMTPDGLPIVSPITPGSSVWLNCGHGAVGWTLSAATGELAAIGVTGRRGEDCAVEETVVMRMLQALSVERFTLRGFFS